MRFFFSIQLKLLLNIGKWDNFIKNNFWKMTHFLENIIVETDKTEYLKKNL